MQLENFSVQAGVQIALEYDDSEDSDSSDCESEHSTEKSSISSGEYLQGFNYQQVIHRHNNLLSALYDDNKEKRTKCKTIQGPTT